MKKIIICTLLLIAALTTVAAAEKYAVLIAPNADGYSQVYNKDINPYYQDNNVIIWCDTYLLWEQLRLKGYKDENIFVLYGNGYDCRHDWLNQRYMSDHQENPMLVQQKITDYPATKSKIQEVFTMLQTKSTADDFVFVWTAGNIAAADSAKTVLPLVKSSLSYSELVNLTDLLKAERKVYWKQRFNEQMSIDNNQ